MEIIIGIIALVGIVYFIQNKKDKGSSVSKPTPAPIIDNFIFIVFGYC